MRISTTSLGIFVIALAAACLPPAKADTSISHLPGSPNDGTSGALLYSLAEDISYVRIQNIEQSLPNLHSLLNQKAVVIDLRFVTSDPESIKTLGNILSINSRASSSTKVILVLCNRETSAPLGRLLQDLQNEGSIIAIGASPNTTNFTPKLSVKVLPEEDGKAYQALLAEMEIETLINESVTKDRYDEARLIKDFQKNKEPKVTTELAEIEPHSITDKIATEAPTSPLTDHILQRAFFLIKALDGLGKLSSI
jgi:hypothetical protein